MVAFGSKKLKSWEKDKLLMTRRNKTITICTFLFNIVSSKKIRRIFIFITIQI